MLPSRTLRWQRRAEAVRAVEDPAGRLRLAIHLGVPSGPDDEESRLLYEIDALTGIGSAFDALSAGFFDRQVALYEGILEAGRRRAPSSSTRRYRGSPGGWWRWRTASGCRSVIGHPAIESVDAERILLDYASAATGADLSDSPVGRQPPSHP